MGGGRAPCCDKSKVKRGPWSPAEDIRLINFIQKNGHPNWRSLPKQAGLLRCGKSCRLRWINYLRPDVKRGNFTPEEEETIIKLHTCLGNRWSKIASHLPGRTDNEIKNVWNTKLKKNKSSGCKEAEGSSSSSSSSCSNGEQNTSHDHQHSSISETNKDLLSSSSSSCSNTNSSPGTDEEMVGHISDQGDKEGGGGDGILEIPILEECDIDIWGILDDLENDGLPLVQSSNNDQELGGADDYTKWLEFFENAQETTTTAADRQIEPSCCNLGDFPLWPNLSPHHNFGF